MKIKNLILGIIVLLISLTAVSAASDISVNMIKYEPSPVMAGNYFTVTFQAISEDYKNITNTEFELDAESGLSIETDDTVKVPLLMPGIPVTFSYRIKSESSARTGYKDLTLSYDNEEETFEVFVKAIETTLVVDKVEQEQFSSGNTGKLTLHLKNEASFSLKDVVISLSLTGIPFAPSESIAQKSVDTITSFGSEDIVFDLITMPEAEAGIYKIPIVITYYDEFGKMYNESNFITIIVSATPYLDISTEKNELIQNTKSTITIKLVNRGLTKLKFLNINLLDSNDFKTLSTKTIYIGDLNIDDYDTIKFDLIPAKSGNMKIPLLISYKDSNNKDYTQVINYDASVYSVKEAKQAGLISGSLFGYIIPIIVILAGIFIYRKYRKGKKKHAQ
ncbi:MAG: hypothetical protein WC413_01995 [Candidatus Nanoarchaeia archaeon]